MEINGYQIHELAEGAVSNPEGRKVFHEQSEGFLREIAGKIGQAIEDVSHTAGSWLAGDTICQLKNGARMTIRRGHWDGAALDVFFEGVNRTIQGNDLIHVDSAARRVGEIFAEAAEC